MHLATAKGAPPRQADLEDLLQSRRIQHVVVLGANGTMGYGSGALFTSAVPKVTFLARTKEKAEQGLAAARKLVRSPTVADRVETGSYDDDFEAAVAKADLIFEAVTEKLDLKRQFFERIDEARRDDAIVATVTSGLSINQLAEGRSDSFRKHFLGLHFFNPPNVIVGTELVPGKETAKEVADFVEAFAQAKLGRVMVRTADTPGFAGNRVGFKVLNEAAQLAEEHGPVLVDRLVGPYTGRALPPLATVDLVGWDIHKAIVDNIYEHAPDEAHATLKLPEYMEALIGEGTLGRKSGKGFFMKDGKRKMALDPRSRRYVPVDEIEVPKLGWIDEIQQLHHIGDYRGAMQKFAAAPGAEADLARKVIAGYISYSFHRAGEVTDDIQGIDLIMGFGFNWAPPSVLVDHIGVKQTVQMIEKAGLPVPEQLAQAAKKGDAGRMFAYPLVDVGRFFVAA
ncbi:MAG: 3-hydroxyacyl-CoA dehydrogenase family protein [Myxococcota bacterium]